MRQDCACLPPHFSCTSFPLCEALLPGSATGQMYSGECVSMCAVVRVPSTLQHMSHNLTAAREVYIPCDSPCNNGLCDYTFGTCVCHPFYTGEQCDRPLSEYWSDDMYSYRSHSHIQHTQCTVLPCGNYYCFNEGTCEMNGSGKKYCQCPQGFSGEYCLTHVNSECCRDRMNCCVLLPKLPPPSNTACPCLNGGICVIQNNVTTCTCPDGFYGSRCEIQRS